MPIRRFRAEQFRCLSAVDLEFDPTFNVVVGPNASGKTSLLEAIAYLGRARSFRGAPVTSLVQHEKREFILFGTAVQGDRSIALGVRNGPDGLEAKVDGSAGAGAADLVSAMPLQVIDPDVHELVAGGPDQRRRFLDGVAFHVEHGFLDQWRRYRRILKQRNAALRAGGKGISTWTKELAGAGDLVDAARREVLEICLPALEEQTEGLLGAPVAFEYRSGWVSGKTLVEALEEATERDIQSGSTQVGPHRADLKLVYDERQAKRLVSRGQQKLLACAMVLAAADVVQTALEAPMLLLLDDPAAELDSDSLSRLIDHVSALGCQVVATSLTEGSPNFPGETAWFHVEHGNIERRK